MRSRIPLAMATAAACSLAAVPAAPAEPLLHGVVEVATLHHEVPDGILTGDVTIVGDTTSPGMCPAGDSLRISCDDAGAVGEATAAVLGFSTAHRHGLPAPEGTVRDVVQVEPTDSGALSVTFELPPGFASTITAAPGAVSVTDRTAVWSRAATSGIIEEFEVLLTAPGTDVSELGEVTVELDRVAAPLVTTAFEPVASPTGSLTTRVVMAADRDVAGVAPTFTGPDRGVRFAMQDRAVGLIGSAEVVSNGTYSGVAQGYVEGLLYDARANPPLYKPYDVENGTGITAYSDHGGRLQMRPEPFELYWGTSEFLPVDHHEVVTAVSLSMHVDRRSDEHTLDQGPQTTDGKGGRIAVTKVGPTVWATGLTSQSIVAQQHDPTERPSRAGDVVALMGLAYHARAVDGDIDNRDGGEREIGDAFEITAPDGWVFDGGGQAAGVRVRFDWQLSQDGKTITATPMIAAGTVFPQEWQGAPYGTMIGLTISMRPDELSVLGLPVPSPPPVMMQHRLGGGGAIPLRGAPVS